MLSSSNHQKTRENARAGGRTRARARSRVKNGRTICVVAALRGLNEIAFVFCETNAILFNPRKAATTRIFSRNLMIACFLRRAIKKRAKTRAWADARVRARVPRQKWTDNLRCGRLTRIERNRVCFVRNKHAYVQSA